MNEIRCDKERNANGYGPEKTSATREARIG